MIFPTTRHPEFGWRFFVSFLEKQLLFFGVCAIFKAEATIYYNKERRVNYVLSEMW